jgi:hypothetical protein
MSTLAPAAAGPVTAFVRHRPLTAFFLWFFTVGQAFAFLPLLVDVPYPQVFIDLSTVVGLLLPALAITRIVDGPQALRALLRSAFRWRVAPRWYALALVAVPGLTVALALGFGGTPSGSLWAALVPGFALQLLVAFLLNNWWEEVAWAGFVGVRLQERFGSTLRAALVAGPLFALQHVSGVVGNDLVTGVVLLLVLAVLVTPSACSSAGWSTAAAACSSSGCCTPPVTPPVRAAGSAPVSWPTSTRTRRWPGPCTWSRSR